jgi:hypothetical protein
VDDGLTIESPTAQIAHERAKKLMQQWCDDPIFQHFAHFQKI